ncbi:MAG: pyridoxal 5'-phosphate synthase glutaminase subunit PdxT [Alphaproteobacteria bacterium]|nr:pyridoxal 5'-phosphate synthase glutaminase subunit PdxT [Alphaproteobacteria bacterium]
MTHPVTIGVLALQGAVQPHKSHIEAAGAAFRAVKTPEDFAAVDAFILPGGESTTMLKLIENFGLWDSLLENFRKKPIWGICAGCILLADTVTDPAQKSFGILPITVRRNGYGRQIDSHIADIQNYPVSFIRAPIITKIGPGVETLAAHEGDPVWLAQGKNMVTTFHPELTLEYPSPMHRLFIEGVKGG